MPQYVIAALYQFADFHDFEQQREPLLRVCEQLEIKGTILVAHEGINGTIAGSRDSINSVIGYIRKELRFNNLEYKESYSDTTPFLRMKVKLKKEIVTLGVEGVNPAKLVGEYVDPQDWNTLIDDPEVVVVDTRNEYEYAVGTFRHAINPNTKSFRDFPQFVEKNLDPSKHKKVAMFCTGGIRCEKATAYMRTQGFEQVYHLKGGILKYLETVPQEQSLWQGDCFVFDERVTVNHSLEKGEYDQCYGCRMPITDEDKQSPKYTKGVSCPHCFDNMTTEQRKSNQERQRQIEFAKKRNQTHLGQKFARHKKIGTNV